MPPMSPDQIYIVEGTDNDDLLTPTNPTSTANDRVLTFEIDAGSGNDTLYATNGPSDWPTFSAGATATTATHGLTVQNHLYGGEGNDFFFDRAGFSGLTANQAAMYGITTTMSGGVGNDTYRLVRTNTIIVEDMNAGTDQIIASRDYVNAVIAANADFSSAPMFNMSNFGNVENFAFASDAQNVQLLVYGNSLSNVIRGNTMDNSIYGGAGADKLYGMDGADYLWGGSDFDSLFGGQGNDFSNGDGGNDLLLGGADDDTLYGGTESDRLFGQDGNDSISGDTGDDSLYGGTGKNYLSGGEGNDFLVSAGIRDALYGGDGSDRFQADGSSQQLDGGAGDDTYFVSSTTHYVGEVAGEGLDRVVSSQVNLDGTFEGNYYYHVETLQLSGTLDLNITANLYNTTLLGNAGANMITAANVATVMRGGAGDDTLVGGSGNDVLGGGSGNDSMTGGAGDDTYVVDSANDIVIELSGRGTDTLITSTLSLISGTSAQLYNIENVTLTGALNLSATLGLNNNVLTGNDGDNNLNSGEGHDTVYGGEGADTLAGQDGNDSLDGGAGNDSLNGAFGADTLVGGDGDDTLRGDVRNDTLTGGSGADVFLFSDDGLSSTDVITDFETGVDRIDLTAFGPLNDASFASPATGGFFAYSTSNGVSTLIVDTDGNGVNEFTIILTNGPATLTAADVIYDPFTIS